MKKIAFISLLLIVISFTSIFLIVGKYNNNLIDNYYERDDIEELYFGNKIFNTMDELDDYLADYYDYGWDYTCTTTNNYGVLSTQNLNQSNMYHPYNLLGDLRFDLNNDNIINNNDNIGGGICQLIAVTTLLRYLINRFNLNYTPRINNDLTNPINVFYDVVDI